jgi:hypothetical protein
MDAPLFDFDEVFDRDYLYVYGLRIDESDSEADAVWRLLRSAVRLRRGLR